MAEPVSLNLGVVGNCVISALIDVEGRVVWSCLPRLDGDPVFHALVDTAEVTGADQSRRGSWEIHLAGRVRSEQSYRPNTAILTTRLYAADGSAIEITDFCPRFKTRGRMFRPQMLVRRVRALAGTPRISVRLRPSFDYGAREPEITHGSNHVRYVTDQQALRLTTNAPVSYLLKEEPFLLEGPTSFVLGPDETLRSSVEHTAREFEEETESYWRLWTRSLALPLEWQDRKSVV